MTRWEVARKSAVRTVHSPWIGCRMWSAGWLSSGGRLQPNEAYQIVRQRLFIEPTAEQLASIGETAREFVDMYRKHNADFPRATLEKPYEDRIKQSYPIHPELFDRLYERMVDPRTFSAHPRRPAFDEHRDSRAVEGRRHRTADHVSLHPLERAEVNAELTQYLQDSWKAVIDADVAGPKSTPARIDNARSVFGQRSLTQRLARTVFFGAAPTIGSAQKGWRQRACSSGPRCPAT